MLSHKDLTELTSSTSLLCNAFNMLDLVKETTNCCPILSLYTATFFVVAIAPLVHMHTAPCQSLW